MIEVEDTVVMIRDEDGTLEIRQGSSGVGGAAISGAISGSLIGYLLMAPLFGLAAGALAGGAIWKTMFGDAGVAESFVKEHGQVIRTSLSDKAERQLADALAAAERSA